MNPNGKKEKMIIHLFGEITFFVMKKYVILEHSSMIRNDDETKSFLTFILT